MVVLADSMRLHPVMKMTMKELRATLRAAGLKSSGKKKKILQDRVMSMDAQKLQAVLMSMDAQKLQAVLRESKGNINCSGNDNDIDDRIRVRIRDGG